MTNKTILFIPGKITIKPLVVGCLVGVVGSIIGSNIYWFLFMKLYFAEIGSTPFYSQNQFTTKLLFNFGSFIFPMLWVFAGGYSAKRLSKSSGILNSLFVGFAGTLFCFGYIFISGSAVEHPKIYTLLGILWIPVSVLGGWFCKLIRKT